MRRPAAVDRLGPAVPLLLALAACGGDGPSAPAASPPPAALNREQAVREAVRVTAAAQAAVMRSVRPGLRESDVKAMVDEVFRREGADGLAFEHIAAAGSHATDAHYSGGDGLLVDGDLLVLDIGAVRAGWAADLTRTMPVGGRFTPRQRELYALALEGQELALRGAHTGVDSLYDMQAWVTDLYRRSPLRAADADGVPRTLDVFNPYRLGHYLGRLVHGEDTGWDWRAPLQAGQALTIEPGLYVVSEGLGLRVEDDFWVSEAGLECLSCAVPRHPEEIEALMEAGRTQAATVVPRPGTAPLPVEPSAVGRPHLLRRDGDQPSNGVSPSRRQ